MSESWCESQTAAEITGGHSDRKSLKRKTDGRIVSSAFFPEMLTLMLNIMIGQQQEVTKKWPTRLLFLQFNEKEAKDPGVSAALLSL